MRIVNLIENTEGSAGCAFAHGLSFYVETTKHKLLADLGPSEETIKNAEKLGIDLAQVDTVILSHGHYDHSGGIMAFSKINPDAVIYMQESAGDDHYADNGESEEGERYRYIGIDKDIMNLPQVKTVQGDHRIDDELELLTVKERTHKLPFTNKSLLIKENDEYVRDDFRHEHYLVISGDNKKILISGCAHNGILSILDSYKEKYGSYPDAVISGFHLRKKVKYTDEELREIVDIGRELKKYPTTFYTCHCTGEPAYKMMKLSMGEQLQYVHSGDEVTIKKWVVKKKGGLIMAKALVAYFSASGVTKKLAEKLAGAIGADIFEIVPEQIYTDADLNWQDQQSRSSVEMKDRSCRPAIASKVENMDQYDAVFVGFPVWWYREPSIIDTFAEAYDFAGKTIVPFATSGSSGIGESGKNIGELAKGSKAVEGKRFAANASADKLRAWAEEYLK